MVWRSLTFIFVFFLSNSFCFPNSFLLTFRVPNWLSNSFIVSAFPLTSVPILDHPFFSVSVFVCAGISSSFIEIHWWSFKVFPFLLSSCIVAVFHEMSSDVYPCHFLSLIYFRISGFVAELFGNPCGLFPK